MIIPDPKIVEAVIASMDKSVDLFSIREINRCGSEIQKRMKENSPDFELSTLNMGIPGLKTPQCIIDAQKEALDMGVGGQYAPFDGIEELKEASHEYLRSSYNADVAPLNHLPTPGAMMGCRLALQIAKEVIPDKQKVLFLQPGFSVTYTQAKQVGIPSVSLELCEDAGSYLRGERLCEIVEKYVEEEDISAIMWNSPNNPSWLILTDEEYKGFASIADKHDVLLIHDAAYGPMDFSSSSEHVPSPIQYTKNTILLYSASKMLSYAGERVGILVADDSLMKRKMPNGNVWQEIVQAGLYTNVASVCHSAQYGLAKGLREAVRDSGFIKEHCKPYEEQGREVKHAFLDNGFNLVYTEPDGTLGAGFYFTASRDGYKSSEMIMGLLRSGVSVVPLDIFGVERSGARVCTSLMNTPEKREILRRRLEHYNLRNPV